MPKSRYYYYDVEIQNIRGATFYLHYKIERKTNYTVISVRTQRKGKGYCICRVQGYSHLDGDNTGRDVLLMRINKKWAKEFFFVRYVRVIDGMVQDHGY